MWVLAFLLVTGIGDVVEVEASVTSRSQDASIQDRALAQAMDTALSLLVSQTGMLLSQKERDALSRKASSFVLRTRIKRYGFDTTLGLYVFKAAYTIDLGRVVRVLGAMRTGHRTRRINLYFIGVPPPLVRDARRLFPPQAWRVNVVQNPKRLPRRCPRGVVCLRISFLKERNVTKLEYAMKQGRRKWKGLSSRVVEDESTVFLALPQEVSSALGVVSWRRLRYGVEGFDDAFDALKFIEVLRKQRGNLLRVYSWSLDDGKVVLDLDVLDGTLANPLDGLFLGEGITLVPGTQEDGIVWYRLSMPTGEEDHGEVE